MSIPYYRYHPSPKKPGELDFCTFCSGSRPSHITVNILVRRSLESWISVLSLIVPARPLLQSTS